MRGGMDRPLPQSGQRSESGGGGRPPPGPPTTLDHCLPESDSATGFTSATWFAPATGIAHSERGAGPGMAMTRLFRRLPAASPSWLPRRQRCAAVLAAGPTSVRDRPPAAPNSLHTVPTTAGTSLGRRARCSADLAVGGPHYSADRAAAPRSPGGRAGNDAGPVASPTSRRRRPRSYPRAGRRYAATCENGPRMRFRSATGLHAAIGFSPAPGTSGNRVHEGFRNGRSITRRIHPHSPAPSPTQRRRGHPQWRGGWGPRHLAPSSHLRQPMGKLQTRDEAYVPSNPPHDVDGRRTPTPPSGASGVRRGR
jgi:hypothetical protein